MLMARLECVNGEYILRIPKRDVLQYDLHDGQLLAVALEPMDAFGTIGVEESAHPVERWKLNEPRQRYESDGCA